MTNKTKRLSKRVLSMLVCFAMLCSMSLTSIALPQSVGSSLLNAVDNVEALSSGNQLPIVTSDLAILCDGVQVQDVILPMGDAKDLSLATNGLSVTDVQWQILVDRDQNQWADIQEATDHHFRLSYAVVMSALYDGDVASMRVSAKDDAGNLLVSEPLLVKVTEMEELPLLVSENAPLLALSDPTPAAAGESDTDYITITINYLSADDPSRQVYSPYTASVLTTSSYSQNVLSPTQIGFAPYYIGEQGAPSLDDGDTVTATYAGEERTYTYNATAGTYTDNATSAVETDSDWLTAIESAIIHEAATVTADSIYVSYDYGVSPVQDIVYNVYYVSIDVPYSVRYYFQNINDDEYTQNAAISFIGMAKTGTIVDDNTLEQPVYDFYGVEPGEDFGFSALYHYPESVAADGSTVFDYYFDRNYYIIKFDNNGGYGVEPIYARYDASFVVTPPVRPGYVFQGWDEITTYEFNVYANVGGVETQVGTQTLTAAQYVDLGSPSAYTRNYTAPNGTVYQNATHRFVDSYGDGTADEGTSASHTFNGNIAARTVAYKALWSVTNSNVNIIYWKENANDDGYSYWGADTVYAVSSSTVGGSTMKIYKNGDNYVTQTVPYTELPASLKTGDYNQFYYSHADSNVLVEGDGSSAVNVYYRRNVYSITLRDSGVACQIEEHTHTDDCYDYLCDQHVHTADCYDCGKEEIPHTEACCSLVEHTHTADCLLECTKEEHTHTNTCYTCGYAPDYHHIHTAACCNKSEHVHDTGSCICGTQEHVHTLSCYTSQQLSTDDLDYTSEIDNPVNGTIYRYARRIFITSNYYNYFYVNNTWYYIGNNKGNTTGSIGGISFAGTLTNPNSNNYNSVTANTVCNKMEHKHSSTCCTLTAHTHTDGTCNYSGCTLDHTHTADCLQCGKEEHVHSDACHYACGKVEHHHTNACCTREEHTHTISCYAVGGTYHPNGNNQNVHISTQVTSYARVATATINGVTLYYNAEANSPVCVDINGALHPLYYGNSEANTIRSDRINSNRYYFNNLTFTNTCTKTEHAHGDGSCTYGCGLTEHTHTDFCYNCGLKTHTHGDGNCNANACTNPSHHTHNDTCLGCGYAGEHVHTADCPYGLVCTKPEHRHTNDDRTYKIVKIIQAKYGQTIVDEWNFTTSGGLVYPKTTTTTSWDPVSDTELTQRLAFVAVMPGRNLVFNHHSTSNSKRSYNYYIECLPGETGAATYGGKNYKHYLSNGTLTVDFNSWTRAEDFFPIDGFTANVATNNGSTISGSSTTLGSNATVNMYYTRNSYTLDFFNADGSIISSQNVPFEQNIKSYADALGTPPYPSTLEENAYEFVGWYTTSGCYNGSELKDTEKMPAGNFAVYAKWVPLTHHVRFFETYDDMLAYEASVAAGTPDESLVYVKPTAPDVEYSIETSHGSYIGSIPNPDKLRVTNPGGSVTEYDFGGWFFIQNGSKKAYTPLDMPVTRDLNVFADWGSHSAQPYVVHYALNEAETDTHFLNLLPRASLTYADLTQTVTFNDEARTYVCLNDGGDTYGWHRVIANDTMGYAYQGTTRTFTAKAGDPFNQLFEGFNVHYFPTVSSHSITVAFEESSVDPRINTFTFRYVEVPNVSYTVKYINSDTGAVLSSPKTVTTTSAVVTERFKVFSGFVPDAFYKQLVLAVAPDPDHPGQWISSPDNVITFYYSENTSSARYTVHFLLQKNGEEARTLTDADYAVSFAADGTYTFSNKFEESGSRVDGVSDKDVNTQISPIDFAGYDLVSNKALEVRGQQNGTWAQNTPTYSDGKYTIFPVMYGTDLFLFYQREEYAYKVYYLLYGTPVTSTDLANYTTVAADTSSPKRVLADTTSGTALYGTSYTATAPEIPGYTCVTNKTITKDITPSVSSNYIVFFYTPLQYTVQYKVWKNGGGTVSNGNETFSDPSTLLGSTATASAGYTFAGWFVDADCTIPATYNPTYNPQGMGTTYEDSTKTTPNTFGAYVFPNVACLTANGTESFAGNIFYAKFNPEFGDLTVRRENSANQGMGNQVFQYEVKNNQTGEVVNITITGDGEVTIKDIAVGTYTVTQKNNWSHRWTDAPKTATVTSTTPGLAVFDTAAVNDKWLNGNSPVAKNVKGATT